MPPPAGPAARLLPATTTKVTGGRAGTASTASREDLSPNSLDVPDPVRRLLGPTASQCLLGDRQGISRAILTVTHAPAVRRISVPALWWMHARHGSGQ